MKFWLFVAIIGLVTCVSTIYGETPTPGKQVAMKTMAPKSNSTWNTGQGYGNLLQTLQTIVPPDDSEKVELQYLLFLPEDYQNDVEKQYPLMLFLHGAGERGTDLEKVKIHGPPMRLAKEEQFRKECPFIVVSPQCLDNHYWSPGQLVFLLDEIEKTYQVDKSRVYVTGISMGGFGSWMMGIAAKDRVAAIAPICGGMDSDKAELFLDLPLWAFHGMRDAVVPPWCSMEIVDAIKEKGGPKVRITLYPAVGHDSWVKAYQTDELYRWFLEQKKD